VARRIVGGFFLPRYASGEVVVVCAAVGCGVFADGVGVGAVVSWFCCPRWCWGSGVGGAGVGADGGAASAGEAVGVVDGGWAAASVASVDGVEGVGVRQVDGSGLG
jgi:hypothetical protein